MSPPGEPAGHRHYEDMAVEHVLGGLDEERGRVFRAHLLECPTCRARVGELRAIASDLAGVERHAKREQRAHVSGPVDTKERDEPHDEAPPPAAQPPILPWVVLGVVLMAALVGLAAYVFALRGQVTGLEQDLRDRTVASEVLEHGRNLDVALYEPEVEATAKLDDDHVALLADGLAADAAHEIVIIDTDGDRQRTEPAESTGGRLLALLRPRVSDDRVQVRRADEHVIFEVDLTSGR